SDRAPSVQPVKINVVSLESSQGPFQRAIDILTAVATGVGIARFGIHREFRGDDDSVAHTVLAHELAYHLFTFSVGIAVGRIQEVAALFEVAVEECKRAVLIGAKTPLSSESHRSQAERAHAQSRPS